MNITLVVPGIILAGASKHINNWLFFVWTADCYQGLVANCEYEFMVTG